MAENNVDLADLIRFFWAKKKMFFTLILGMMALGIVVILITTNQYSSTVKFIAQTNSSSSGNLMRQLGGFSGLNLGSMASSEPGSLSPQLYQEIIYSYPFLWQLSRKEIQLGDSTAKLGHFVELYRKPSLASQLKKYTIGLPKTLSRSKPLPLDLDTQPTDSAIFIRRELVPLFNEYKKIISLSNDTQTGAITIEVQTVSPEGSAQLAAMTFELLSDYVIDYKTEKAKQNLNFVEARFEEARDKFYQAQSSLSNFRDRNQNLNFSTARAQEERLAAEYNLANSLYNNLAVQLDQAKIKFQEDIPQLSVINPPVPSYQPTKPNIPIILAISIFLGVLLGFVAIVFIYFKQHFANDH
jgi:uncharacterized protein involved in exopolysaccharide biosynthesis